MARTANPLTTVSKQLTQIQDKYHKLGILVDKLTKDVDEKLNKDKTKIDKMKKEEVNKENKKGQSIKAKTTKGKRTTINKVEKRK